MILISELGNALLGHGHADFSSLGLKANQYLLGSLNSEGFKTK